MNFTDAVKSVISNYATFSGRASRSEYWYWLLFQVLVSIACSILDSIIFSNYLLAGLYGPLYILWGLAVFIPCIAVAVRRLHDLDRTGWWLLSALTLILGLMLLVWFCMKGTTGPNRYGEDPVPGAV